MFHSIVLTLCLHLSITFFIHVSYTIVGCVRAHSPTYKRYFDHINVGKIPATYPYPPSCRSCSYSPTGSILLSHL